MKSREDRILDAIDEWHKADKETLPFPVHRSLHDYLGWSWEEYSHWVRFDEPPKEREGAI
jgi:hypothetical protein